MTPEDIIRIANETACHDGWPIDEGMERAYICALQTVVQTLRETGTEIDPIRQPDKATTVSCHRTWADGLEVSIDMGGREEQVKCHTPYIVQTRRRGSSQWDTHITSVYEDRFTDIDWLSVSPTDAEEDAQYDVQVLRARCRHHDRIEGDKKFRREFEWELQREHIEFCTGKCPLMKDGLCGDKCQAFWDWHVGKVMERKPRI